MKKIFAAALAAALAAGCASISISSKGGHTMAVVENSGWYLFNAIPIASGDPDNPDCASFSIFGDTVTLENNVKLLERARKEQGAASYKDVVSYTTEESVFLILLKRYYYHTSAELVMPEKTGADEPAQTGSAK